MSKLSLIIDSLTDPRCHNIDEDIEVSSLEFDSRLVKKNSLFFALEEVNSGAVYARKALDNGACAVVSAYPIDDIPNIVVDDPSLSMALASSAFYNTKNHSMKIVGITGTDGKSTTAWFLYNLLKAHHVKVALLSTVMMDDGSALKPSIWRQSTPQSPAIHSFLKSCIANDVSVVVLEATSHGLSHKASRLYGIEFDLAVYTTLTEEHLDFHHSQEAYVDAKLNLIRQSRKGSLCLIQESNSYKDQISDLAKGYGLQSRIYGHMTSSVEVLEKELGKLSFRLNNKKLSFCYSPLFFLDNALGALEAAKALCPDVCDDDLSSLKPLKGRFEVLKLGCKLVIIDFAHTQDAFIKLFEEVRSMDESSSFTAIFGSGGQRDKVKRSLMGKACRHYCSRMILTEEDPRDEGTVSIAMDIDPQAKVVSTREQAIRYALSRQKKNEILFLLGKGHESSIQLDSVHKLDYDERSMVVSIYRQGRFYKSKEVTLLYGGESPEHEVSIDSARTVFYELRKAGYCVEAVKITKKGKWIRTGSVTESDKGLPYALGLDDRPVFPVLHGINCEDGSIAELLERNHIRFWGCDSHSSRIGMDKDLQRRLCKLPTTEYVALSRIDDDLELPLVIKPNASGSSIGVRLVRDKEDLKEAFEIAKSQDPRHMVLAEKPVENHLDIEVGILQTPGGLVTLGPLCLQSPTFILSYDDKYRTDASFQVPCPLDEEQLQRVKAWAMQVFETLGCNGMARVDFLYDQVSGKLCFNEINTIPGFTATSHYPKMLQGYSWNYFFECLEACCNNG